MTEQDENHLTVEITRWVDDHQPGWVACTLLDSEGEVHHFIEKAPVVTLEALTEGSLYPRPGEIACEVISRWKDARGRPLVRVSTARPWGVESVSGRTEFVVLAAQLGVRDA